ISNRSNVLSTVASSSVSSRCTPSSISCLASGYSILPSPSVSLIMESEAAAATKPRAAGGAERRPVSMASIAR
ncbi:MAG: hypothetical protein LQ347_007050, partial [Umbilicaria vellea]